MLFALSILFSVNALAAAPAKPNTLVCTIVLQEPMDDDGGMGLSLPPAQKPVVFDYVVGTEKTVKMTTKLVQAPDMNDPHPSSQYTLQLATADDEVKLTVEFSRVGLDGNKLPNGSYGVFIYTANQGKRNGAWSWSSPTTAFNSDNIELAPKIMGYAILTCAKR